MLALLAVGNTLPFGLFSQKLKYLLCLADCQVVTAYCTKVFSQP